MFSDLQAYLEIGPQPILVKRLGSSQGCPLHPLNPKLKERPATGGHCRAER